MQDTVSGSPGDAAGMVLLTDGVILHRSHSPPRTLDRQLTGGTYKERQAESEVGTHPAREGVHVNGEWQHKLPPRPRPSKQW